MEPQKTHKPEIPQPEEKLHRGSEKNDPQKDKIATAKSANTATQEAGLNKSEHEDEVEASLNKNDINQDIVELENNQGDRSPEDEARVDGPYGVIEEGYGDEYDNEEAQK
ncbi:MAG: hypothetical protein V4714_09440 [Bacteroidota bacterium]